MNKCQASFHHVQWEVAVSNRGIMQADIILSVQCIICYRNDSSEQKMEYDTLMSQYGFLCHTDEYTLEEFLFHTQTAITCIKAEPARIIECYNPIGELLMICN